MWANYENYSRWEQCVGCYNYGLTDEVRATVIGGKRNVGTDHTYLWCGAPAGRGWPALTATICYQLDCMACLSVVLSVSIMSHLVTAAAATRASWDGLRRPASRDLTLLSLVIMIPQQTHQSDILWNCVTPCWCIKRLLWHYKLRWSVQVHPVICGW